MGRHGFFNDRRSTRARGFLALALGVLGLLAVSGALLFSLRMRPLLTKLATAKASNAVTGVVTQAVNEAVASGAVQYEQLVSFQKDNEGRITAVTSNMPAFNRLQSDILDMVLDRLDRVSTETLAIPLGSLTGSTLLAGRGPLLHVRMQSVGSSTAKLENAFITAGINQTKHQILLRMDVYVSILLPGFRTAAQVSNVYTVAETVIVGAVPGTYTYFDTDVPDPTEEAREYVLNKG